MKKNKKTSFLFKFFLLTIIGLIFYCGYKIYFDEEITFKNKSHSYIFIKTGYGLEDIIKEIKEKEIFKNINSFKLLAKIMKLDDQIHPGKYRVNNGIKMRELINLIKYNKQEKVKLSLNYQIHNLDEFIDYLDGKLELDQKQISKLLNDKNKINAEFNLKVDDFFSLITPDVYFVNWAINIDDLFILFKNNYSKIWTSERQNKAMSLGFTVPEIITLASIVQCESNIKSEQEKIAGVYINRLKKDMLLQADPTLKFANKNFNAKRIINKDKAIDSPYNTYKNKGLPPGPICIVYLNSIEAVLNYNKHDFIFFCAKPDLNGYSDFSINYEQHKNFATIYQKALDKKGINR